MLLCQPLADVSVLTGEAALRTAPGLWLADSLLEAVVKLDTMFQKQTLFS